MSAHRVIDMRRATITALPLYYSGHLLKKQKKEKEFKKYYGELRGTTLFLYNDDTQYSEKLDLEELKFMDLKSPYQKKTPTIFTLALPTEEVQLKMENPDTGEEWRGHILTVIKNKIPSKLQLMPGQMLQLQEILAQEQKRKQLLVPPPLPPRPSSIRTASPSPPGPQNKSDRVPEVPECFFKITRKEAEYMLETNPEYGGMILRPSTLTNNYALTLRQMTASGPVMKNFRVSSTTSGFVIELERPVTVSSLHEVLQFFLEKTEYRVHPYKSSQPYDTCIDVVAAPRSISNSSPAKIIPKAQVSPMPHSKKEEPLPPTPKPLDNEYVVPNDQSPDDHEQKLAQLDEELQAVLKLRREATYKEAGQTYENNTRRESSSTLESEASSSLGCYSD